MSETNVIVDDDDDYREAARCIWRKSTAIKTKTNGTKCKQTRCCVYEFVLYWFDFKDRRASVCVCLCMELLIGSEYVCVCVVTYSIVRILVIQYVMRVCV